MNCMKNSSAYLIHSGIIQGGPLHRAARRGRERRKGMGESRGKTGEQGWKRKEKEGKDIRLQKPLQGRVCDSVYLVCTITCMRQKNLSIKQQLCTPYTCSTPEFHIRAHVQTPLDQACLHAAYCMLLFTKSPPSKSMTNTGHIFTAWYSEWGW